MAPVAAISLHKRVVIRNPLKAKNSVTACRAGKMGLTAWQSTTVTEAKARNPDSEGISARRRFSENPLDGDAVVVIGRGLSTKT
jgi:hypothetical protein